jgi:hypothetical protein
LLALLLVEGGHAQQGTLPQVDGSAIPLNKYKVKSLKALISGVPPASCAEWATQIVVLKRIRIETKVVFGHSLKT